MLLEFTVENYRSYRDPARLSLVASSAEELPGNLIPVEGRGLSALKSVVLYGANGSGKSNLLAAMNDLAALVESPTRRPLFERTTCKPFAFVQEKAKGPIRFGASFVLEDVLYEYAVAVQGTEISAERLTAYPENHAQTWFRRRGGEIKLGSKQPSILKAFAKSVPPHQTFLGFAAALEAPKLAGPAKWLTQNLRMRRELGNESSALDSFGLMTTHALEDERFKVWAEGVLRYADVGIVGVETEEVAADEKIGALNIPRVDQADPDRVSMTTNPMDVVGVGVASRVEDVFLQKSGRRRLRPYFLHEDESNEPRRFDFPEESLGTRRLFAMCWPFFEALSGGEVLVIDEFSASLHPLIVRELVRLLHDPRTNPNGAQLIFATHDTNLLSSRLFRRDQVWFTEKDRSGATELYSLHDVKDVRADEAIEKGYLRGRYGAIPFLGEFDFPIPAVAADGE